MSRELHARMTIRAPRFGMDDVYLVTLSDEGIRILQTHVALRRATYDGRSRAWVEGSGDPAKRRPFRAILNNEHVRLRVDVEGGLVEVWDRWMRGDIDDAKCGIAVEHIGIWANREHTLGFKPTQSLFLRFVFADPDELLGL